MLVHDLARTENRFTALRQYCENEARIDPADFHCINYDFCNATLTNPLDAGNKGGLAFVGEQYDIRVRTDDFRLMFVGYDYGTGCSGLVDRRRDIQEYHPRLNPHYKGIVKMLLEIYQESCPSEAETGIWRPLLKRMAQTNATRCCAPVGNAMGCNTNNAMRRACWIHFKREIGILQPTVMIFHGKKLKGPFLECLASENLAFESMAFTDQTASEPDLSEIVYRINFGAFVTTAMFFRHPARGHLGKQWNRLVLPAFNRLRSLGILPNIRQDWTPKFKEDWPAI